VRVLTLALVKQYLIVFELMFSPLHWFREARTLGLCELLKLDQLSGLSFLQQRLCFRVKVEYLCYHIEGGV